MTTALFTCISPTTFASVTILPGAKPKAYTGGRGVASASDFFHQSTPNELWNTSTKPQLILSSYDGSKFSADAGIRPSSDSFVRGAIQAWGEHLHLVIRPDEVWFTILAQMNFYMQANAESVRDLFVTSKRGEKETIRIEAETWYQVISSFQYAIQQKVKTSWLLDWIQPRFTTSTENDGMVANVLMMGLMKTYFNYEGGIICGLPSVTLEGTKADWERLLSKLDRLPLFGTDPTGYRDRLAPILTRFVSSFDAPDSAETKSFWRSIVTATSTHICGAPPYYLSGWILGFQYWDANGQPFARVRGNGTASSFRLDGVVYPSGVSIEDLPAGYARVPFTMDMGYVGGGKVSTMLVAGPLGKKISNGTVPGGYAQALNRSGLAPLGDNLSGHATLQPLSAWGLYGPVDEGEDAKPRRGDNDFEYSELSRAISNGGC
ncbi:hypothetical protein B0T17DRAFT_501269 [Bombardia bombarda]|uniref:Uncharacterized protein n=1 Tax=Bombardia bombarda TaxID=252184 RepID=A0AA39U2F3_9PEZI|nr:hypothetical protein B0T17DRAFT_501269 [Bombardia bombarda]